MAINRSALSRLALPAKLGIGGGAMVLVAVAYFFLFHSEVEDRLIATQATGVTLNADLSKARAAVHAYQ